jgi:hypothetical protein
MPDSGTGGDMEVILLGVVGSTAYGLANEDSDIDLLGIFATPTIDLLGLHQPQQSVVTTHPDMAMHEAGKFCALALKCNPTVTELMWLDEYGGEFSHFGAELVAIRSAFLSKRYVRNAFLGYASQQFRKLSSRSDGSFSSDVKGRTAKHARHLMRLCQQGLDLYLTGSLQVRLDDPQRFIDFGDDVANGNADRAMSMIASTSDAFDAGGSPLPGDPDERTVEDWLLRVRRFYCPTDW